MRSTGTSSSGCRSIRTAPASLTTRRYRPVNFKSAEFCAMCGPSSARCISRGRSSGRRGCGSSQTDTQAVPAGLTDLCHILSRVLSLGCRYAARLLSLLKNGKRPHRKAPIPFREGGPRRTGSRRRGNWCRPHRLLDDRDPRREQNRVPPGARRRSRPSMIERSIPTRAAPAATRCLGAARG